MKLEPESIVTNENLTMHVVGALQNLTEAIWRNLQIDRAPIIKELTRADQVLKLVRRRYVRPATLEAFSKAHGHINVLASQKV